MNIVEFAKQLNLSTGTISRALNDRPEVSRETRRFVLQKARELGFTPSASARRLVTGRSHLIQLECPKNTHILSDSYLVELARGLEEEAGNHGYDLLLHLGDRVRVSAELPAVDGLVIVAGEDTTHEDIRKMTTCGRTPAVLILGESTEVFPESHCICLDRLSGVREALRLLASFGHRRIGYIGSGHASYDMAGLTAELDLPWDADLAIEAGVRHEQGFEAALRLLKSPNPPTALFTRTDILAAGALHAARHLGLSAPYDISIIGHDNIDLASLVTPPLTTVAIDIPTIAAATVELLMERINLQTPPTVRILGTRLVIRESVAEARARGAGALSDLPQPSNTPPETG